MFFAHLLTLLTAFILGLHSPFDHSALNRTTSVKAAATQRSVAAAQSNTATPTPTLVLPSPQSPVVSKPLSQKTIDCIGPDNKHLFVTQQACDNFNIAWKNRESALPTSPWGAAQKIGDHTYSMTFTPDGVMATPQEILAALNVYRQNNGKNSLKWDTTLGSYAQTRANVFTKNQGLDQHAGFNDYIHNQDGFHKLGFNHVGENAAYAGPLTGTHIIDNVFAGDSEHNANQLDSSWTNVGIGVNGIAIDVVFGGSKQ